MKKPELNVADFGENHVIFYFNKSASVNRLYRIKSGHTKPYFIHSKSYMYILEDNREIIDYNFLKCSSYEFSYIFAFCDNRKRDISNHIKLFEDIVFRLFIKDDDSKVKSIRINAITFSNKRKFNYLFVKWTCSKQDYKVEDEYFKKFLSLLK